AAYSSRRQPPPCPEAILRSAAISRQCREIAAERRIASGHGGGWRRLLYAAGRRRHHQPALRAAPGPAAQDRPGLATSQTLPRALPVVARLGPRATLGRNVLVGAQARQSGRRAHAGG